MRYISYSRDLAATGLAITTFASVLYDIGVKLIDAVAQHVATLIVAAQHISP